MQRMAEAWLPTLMTISGRDESQVLKTAFHYKTRKDVFQTVFISNVSREIGREKRKGRNDANYKILESWFRF